MSKLDLKWRLLISIVVVGLAFYAMYPPIVPENSEGKRGKINLGLDLQGGMHMVMDVKTDEAVRSDIILVKKSLETVFRKQKIKDAEVVVPDDGHQLEATFQSSEDREIAKEKLDEYGSFDVSTSTVEGKFKLIGKLQQWRVDQIKENALDQALLTIRNRIDELGVNEPIIQQQKSLSKGAMPRILVQLPGIKNVQRAKEIIGRTALLEFKIVIDGPGAKEDILSAHKGRIPPNTKFFEQDKRQAGKPLYYLLEKDSEVTGNDLDSVRVDKDNYGQWSVAFTLSRGGGKKFANVTQNNINKRLAIVLDDKVQSAPVIQSRISRNGQITGDFTFEEAKDLMIVLKSGALPASVVPFEERTVGPSLGHDSIARGVKSMLLGGLIVMLFMMVWYKFSGVLADIGMLCTLIMLLGTLASLHATLTLPGIAGIILTIGMAVDANVLIFERIREELRQGKTVRVAVETGFSRAFITIMDANVTTLIAAVVLLQFGVGPIRGFAVTLSIGIVASMFAAIFICRVLIDLVLARPSVTKLSI